MTQYAENIYSMDGNCPMEDKFSSGYFDVVVEPGRSILRYWSDLWRFRELMYFLAWRDILVRYKQTVIGIAWSVLRPFVTMIVFTIVFGKLAKLPSHGLPYPVMVFAAMLPWQFFASSLTECSNSLIENANMLTKVYFPRMLIPASCIAVSIVDFAISLVMLSGMMVWYQVTPSWRIMTIPLFFMLALLTSLGFGLWMAALNVKYRDFRYVVPFIVQFGLFISPIGFSSSIVPEEWRLLYSLNPMVGVIDGFRWALLGSSADISWTGLVLSIAVALLVGILGTGYFRKTEHYFADII